ESTEEDRIKLSSYLEVLKNAHTNITKTREEYDWTRDKEDPLFARMDYIEFEFSREPINGHTKADVIVSDVPEQLEDYDFSRDDFLQFEEPLTMVHRNASDIKY